MVHMSQLRMSPQADTMRGGVVAEVSMRVVLMSTGTVRSFGSQTISGSFHPAPFNLKIPTRRAHPRTSAVQRRHRHHCRRCCIKSGTYLECENQGEINHACLAFNPPRQVSSRVSVRTPKVPFLFDHKEQSSGSRTGDEMTRARLSVKASPNSMNFLLDTGNPLLNCTLDGVLKIGGVGAAHAATQEAYSWMRKGICTAGTEAHHNRSSSQIHSSPVEHVPTTRRDIEKIVKKAGKEGLQWGMVAGMYAGFEYGMGKARGGKHDWKNAAVGGALTGAILSVSDGRISQDKMVRTALTASALATAAEFLKLF